MLLLISDFGFRRTGKNIKVGKNIRVNKDGFEEFDDYMSESGMLPLGRSSSFIIPTQLSAANLAQCDWSSAYRKWCLYFDKSLEPETGTTWTIFFATGSKICGRADNFKMKLTGLELEGMNFTFVDFIDV